MPLPSAGTVSVDRVWWSPVDGHVHIDLHLDGRGPWCIKLARSGDVLASHWGLDVAPDIIAAVRADAQVVTALDEMRELFDEESEP